MAVAPLKRQLRDLLLARDRPSPRPYGRGSIEASTDRAQLVAASRKSPRPYGRGSIEAFTAPPARERRPSSPRPYGRGSIEAATRSSDGPRPSSRLHDRMAVAPLKLVPPRLRPRRPGLVSTAVWPWLH